MIRIFHEEQMRKIFENFLIVVVLFTPAAALCSQRICSDKEVKASNFDHLSYKQTEDSIALIKKGCIVWQFNYGKNLAKPYFHPLSLDDGTVLTWKAPPDHPWHYGLWFSWKYINGVN